MRVGELFAGAGGMASGFKAAGWETAWVAEIADVPRAILRRHWPDVPLLGDVTQLDGRQLVEEHGPIDCLAGGSPCQGLSNAGRGAGLEDPRSALFHHQMRLWDETGAPLCLWENVRGALTTNQGRDFQAVLSAFVGATVPLPVDRRGKRRPWPRAGRVSGPTGVAAWRLLDARYFGVAQRRLRVFVLGARTGVVDPGEVLLELEVRQGDPPPRAEAWERAPRDLPSEPGERHLAFDCNRGSEPRESSPSLRPMSGARPNGGGNVAVVAYDLAQITWPGNTQNVEPGDPSPTLNYRGECYAVTVAGEETSPPIGASAGRQPSEDGSGRGLPIVVAHGQANAEYCEGFAPTLTLLHEAPIVVPECAGTLTTGGNNPGSISGQDVRNNLMVAPIGRPRRITPRESERLMGWDDDWTLVPFKGKPTSDAARYRAIGNGVVRQCAQWIAARLAYYVTVTKQRAP